MVFGQAFWSERPSGGGLETEVSAPIGEVGRSSSARPSGRKLDRPSGLLFRYLGRPKSLRVGSQRCLLGRAFDGKLVHEGPQVYEPDRLEERELVKISKLRTLF